MNIQSIVAEKAGSLQHEYRENKRFAGMMLASAVLGTASFLTTYWGMVGYGLGYLTSAFVSFGVQFFMAVLAFMIGYLLARNDRASRRITALRSAWRMFVGGASVVALAMVAWFVATDRMSGSQMVASIIGVLAAVVMLWRPAMAPAFFAYIIAMGISVTFSFESIFSEWGKGDRVNKAMVYAKDDVATVIRDLGKKAEETEQARLRVLLEGEGWKKFEGAIKAVVSQAAAGEQAIRSAEIKRISDETRRITEAERKKADELKKQREAEALMQNAEAELKRLEPQRDTLETQVSAAQRAFDAAKLELEARRQTIAKEISGALSGRDRCGPRCRYYQTGDPKQWPANEPTPPQMPSEQELKAVYEKALIAFDGPKKQLDALSARISQLKVIQAQAKGDANVAAATISAEGATVAPAPVVSASAASLDQVSATALDAALTTYKQAPSTETLGKIEQLCVGMNAAFRRVQQDQKSSALKEMDCGQQYRTEAMTVFALQTERAAYQKECGAGADAVKSAAEIKDASGAVKKEDTFTDVDRRQVFQKVVRKGRECLSLAPVGVDTTRPSRMLTNLETGINPDSTNRLAASVAAFDRFDGLALFAGILALAMDSLLLFAGIYGAQGAASPLVKSGSYSAEDEERIMRAVLDAGLDIKLDDTEEVARAKTFLGHLHVDLERDDDLDYYNIIDLTEIRNDYPADVKQVQQILRMGPYFRRSMRAEWVGREVYQVHIRLIHDLCRRIDIHQRKVVARDGGNPDLDPRDPQDQRSGPASQRARPGGLSSKAQTTQRVVPLEPIRPSPSDRDGQGVTARRTDRRKT